MPTIKESWSHDKRLEKMSLNDPDYATKEAYALDYREIPVTKTHFNSWDIGDTITFQRNDGSQILLFFSQKVEKNKDDWASISFIAKDMSVTIEIINHGDAYEDDWLVR